jgi:hypothetical protein
VNNMYSLCKNTSQILKNMYVLFAIRVVLSGCIIYFFLIVKFTYINFNKICPNFQGKFEKLEPQPNYDAKVGFVLNLTKTESSSQSWIGSYMCSPSLNKTFDRVYVNLLRKPGWGYFILCCLFYVVSISLSLLLLLVFYVLHK